MLENAPPEAWDRCLTVVRPVLLLAPDYLRECRERLAAEGVQGAVAQRDTGALFDWMTRLLARQGISNAAAESFIERHGSPRWGDLRERLPWDGRCPRLRSYWTFAGCGYRRLPPACNTPHHLVGCPATAVPARKGTLATAAVGLLLFLRDICDGDFVGWIDGRLAGADRGEGVERLAQMRAAVLDPLVNIPGSGPKIWSMILAELLLCADQRRTRWVEAGASFVAIDSLVHAYLRRSGILRRLGADHAYGPACYAPGGCSAIIEQLARCIDARGFAPENPSYFPRFVQFAIWRFCAADSEDVCNANRIDDRFGCRQTFCVCLRACDRLPIKRPTA